MEEDYKEIKSVSKNTEESRIPKDAEITSKDVTMTVREIENGFIITKSFHVRWKRKIEKYEDSAWYEKVWYSKDNPVKVDTKDKNLAESFE